MRFVILVCCISFYGMVGPAIVQTLALSCLMMEVIHHRLKIRRTRSIEVPLGEILWRVIAYHFFFTNKFNYTY